jgi:hypothetical protein
LKADAQDELCRVDHIPVSANPGENEFVRHSSVGGINLQNERPRSASLAKIVARHPMERIDELLPFAYLPAADKAAA